MFVSERSTAATAWLARAERVPGRSLTRSKAPGKLWPIGQGPLYVTGGSGAFLFADDGQTYLDTLCALGAVSLGYGATPRIASSHVYSLPHRAEVDAADAVLSSLAPWASHVRFTKTGTESTLAALLMAQRATGRRVYWRLTGSYHGWAPQWQEDAPDARWFGVGEVPPVLEDTAAVILEPPRWEAFTADWWQRVFDAAHAMGALVLVDEMIWGGRMALGGATERFGLLPDAACYGKAIGNGAPIACVVGRDLLRDHGELVSGTFSGDAIALEAVVTVLADYQRDKVVEWMWDKGRRLQRGLQTLAQPYDWVHAEGEAVHQRLRFDDEAHGHAFSAEMAARGILWHPACANVMAAHTDANIDRVIQAAGESLSVLAAEIEP